MVPVWYFAPRFIWQDWFSSSRMKQNFNCKERIIKSRVIKSICLVAKHCLLRCVAKRQPMSSFYVDGFVFFFFFWGGGVVPLQKKPLLLSFTQFGPHHFLFFLLRSTSNYVITTGATPPDRYSRQFLLK
jgi:hypothetical protein